MTFRPCEQVCKGTDALYLSTSQSGSPGMLHGRRETVTPTGGTLVVQPSRKKKIALFTKTFILNVKCDQ